MVCFRTVRSRGGLWEQRADGTWPEVPHVPLLLPRLERVMGELDELEEIDLTAHRDRVPYPARVRQGRKYFRQKAQIRAERKANEPLWRHQLAGYRRRKPRSDPPART